MSSLFTGEHVASSVHRRAKSVLERCVSIIDYFIVIGCGVNSQVFQEHASVESMRSFFPRH